MLRKLLLLSASLLCFAGLQSFAAAAPQIISEPLAAPKIEQNFYILAKADSDSAVADTAKKAKSQTRHYSRKAKAEAAATEEKAAKPHKTSRSKTAAETAGTAAGGAVSSAGRTYTQVAGDKGCICTEGHYCLGPRGGHYCLTSGGHKRYLKHH